MSIFYENYVKLCNSKNKSPSGVALEIGLSKTAVNGWKHERSYPTDATAQKIADYFGISVEELLGENGQKEKPANDNVDELSEDEVNFIKLFRLVPEQDKALVVEMVRAALHSKGLL